MVSVLIRTSPEVLRKQQRKISRLEICVARGGPWSICAREIRKKGSSEEHGEGLTVNFQYARHSFPYHATNPPILVLLTLPSTAVRFAWRTDWKSGYHGHR